MRLPLVAPLVYAVVVLLTVPGLAVAQSATPHATPIGFAPTADVRLDVVLEDLADEDYYDVRLERWRFQPGPAMVQGNPLGAPSAIAVDAGTITATIGETSQMLQAGDQLLIPGDQPQAFGNAGATEAVLLWVTFAPGGMGADAEWDPLAIAFEHAAPTFMATPPNPARVLVERFVLPPGTSLLPYTVMEPEQLGIEAGRLGLTVTGEELPVLWKSGRERALAVSQDPPALAPGWQVLVRNAGDDPLILLRLRIGPTVAGTPVP